MTNLPNRRGTGAFKWDLAKSGEIPLWVADMDYPVAPGIVEALEERVAHPVFGYTLVPDSYYQAFCRWQLERNHWEISPDHLVAAPGVMPSISLLIEAWTAPGEAVAMFSPVYFPFFEVVEQLQRRVVTVPLGVERTPEGPRQVIDPDRLDQALDQARVLLVCSPHNPGGRVWSRQELETIAEAARRRGVRVISDEIHGDLIFPGERFVPWHALSGADPRDVALQAPSKTFNIAGLPTAMAIIPDAKERQLFLDALHRRKQDLSNILAITAAEAGYSRGASWLEGVCRAVWENRQLLRQDLAREPGVEVYAAEGTFVPWVDCSVRWQNRPDASEQFCLMARREGVWVSQGRQFGPEGEGHLRVNVATSPGILREGLSRLRRTLELFDGQGLRGGRAEGK
ncbi:cystathione beta-lyase [Alkalispirochaeta americana]|uniref:cysteine-S-conjugate beta-lyase n=2 Tax=Alkalispirochaeta americana TaxID=159291 RepID=A0A1N6SGG4_9SPIO|nr:cystathione beta-lyase [Alkalispirochaeta americana]